MCDYSLYSNETRLAEEGEQLVLHKFDTGTLGFAAVADVIKAEAASKAMPDTFWASMRRWLIGCPSVKCAAICIPPGARMLLSDLPLKIQKSLRVGPLETVIFTEISDRCYSYRDAVVLSDGTRVLLQDLPTGIHAVVLSMSPEPSIRLPHEELRVA